MTRAWRVYCLWIIVFLLLGCAAPVSTPAPSPEPTPEEDQDQDQDQNPDPDPESDLDPESDPESDPEVPDCTVTLDPGDWTIVYTGYGTVDLNGPDGFLLEPMVATDPGETHAALVLSNEIAGCSFQDFRLTVRATTEAQLRTPTPNLWEVFWIFFNYQTTASGKETNYFILKTNGIELGQAYDSVGQNFLFTAGTPALSVGQEYKYSLEKMGTTLTVSIDDVEILSYGNGPSDNPLYDQPGFIGLYTEDARVRIRSVLLEEI